MVEVRKPTPMTPERARILSLRFLVASAALMVLTVALGLWVHIAAAIFSGLFALLALLESRSCEGWRGGYLARERHEPVEAERSMRGETR